LAKILAVRHGFHCTVLFAIDPKDGTIKPDQQDNIPGLEALGSADLMVILTRFRDLPDDQMQHVVNYVESGRPIVALRTSTHAFALQKHKTFSRYDWQSKEWDGGFGRHVLGETWINHHGQHGKQSTLGIIPRGVRANYPILRGIHDGDIWGPTDVYATRDRMPGCVSLVFGKVLSGMHPTDPPVQGKQNDPMMPIAWIKMYTSPSGKEARVFTTTMGASQDLLNEGLRRLIVNACYWGLGMDDQIAPKSNVDLVGPYHPTPFGFSKYTKGIKPSAHALRE
jgi:Trehalose utilisation